MKNLDIILIILGLPFFACWFLINMITGCFGWNGPEKTMDRFFNYLDNFLEK